MIDWLAEKALCIAKRWNKLHYKVKYRGSILSVFSKPLTCQTFEMDSLAGQLSNLFIFALFAGISRDDFLCRVIATLTPDTLIHTYLIEFEPHGIISCSLVSTRIRPHLHSGVSLS